MKKNKIKLTSLAKYTILIVSLVQFLNPFMASAVGIALPTIGRDLGANALQLGMVETTYLLACTIFLIPCGKYADINGRKKIFISGIIVFTIATVLLILTNNISLFITIRFFQGIGAAMITTTGLVILTLNIHPKRRGWAMGIVVACIYMATSAGPTLSGFLVTHFGWKSIFIFTLPLEIIALVLTVMKLEVQEAETEGHRFNWTSSILFMISMSAIVLGTTGMNKNSLYLLLLLCGILGLIYFISLQRKIKNPLLDVRLFAENKNFTFSNIATMINYAASFGAIFIFSIYLQEVKGYNPLEAGLIMITQPLVQVLFSYVSGLLSDKYTPAKIATLGMIFCSAGMALAMTIGNDSSISLIYMILVTLGTGFGLFSSANMTAIMHSVPQKHYGTASSMIPTMRTTGMLASMTIVTILLSVFLHNVPIAENRENYVKMMQYAFTIFFIMSIPGIMLSFGRIKPVEYNISPCE